MKKGFLHIVEIVIVGLLMFLVISQFGFLPMVKSNWPRTKLYLQGNDIIYTLESKDINWFDVDRVSSEIDAMLPESTKYDMKLKNVIRPEIYVGCLCSPEEYEEISGALTSPSSMNINGQEIEFFPYLLDQPNFSLKYDVIIIGQDMAADLSAHRDEIEAYLANDRGIIELLDLEEGDIDELQKELFNLKWDDVNVIPPSTAGITFRPVTNTYAVVPPIEKYFYHFPNSSLELYTRTHYFDNFLSGEQVNASDGNTDKIILQQSGTATPAAIVNYDMAGGVGRTVWMSSPDVSDDDIGVLLKAMAAWAAGDVQEIRTEFFLSGEAVSFSFFKVLNEDMYQPIEILFTLGYLYTYKE